MFAFPKLFFKLYDKKKNKQLYNQVQLEQKEKKSIMLNSQIEATRVTLPNYIIESKKFIYLVFFLKINFYLTKLFKNRPYCDAEIFFYTNLILEYFFVTPITI
jgi:hypothetical protein